MALVPAMQGLEVAQGGLSAIEKANIAKFVYDETKSLVGPLIKSRRQRNRRRRQRQRRQRSNAGDPPSVGHSLAQHPEMAPNAVGSVVKQQYHSALREYRITHSELVSDIFGSTGFNVTSLRVNPGNLLMFAWLSAIAPNFESYRFNHLKFYLKPQCSTTTSGSVMMAFDSDPTDAAPADKRSLMTYEGAVRSAPWQNSTLIMTEEMKERLPKYFVAQNASTGSQARLNDIALLFVATQGQSGVGAVSELWVEYDLTLMTPQSKTCDISCVISALSPSGSVSVQNIGADAFYYDSSTLSVVSRVQSRFVVNAVAYMTADGTITSSDNFAIYVNGSLLSGYRDSLHVTATGLTYDQMYARSGVDLMPGDVITWAFGNLSGTVGNWKICLNSCDQSYQIN